MCAERKLPPSSVEVDTFADLMPLDPTARSLTHRARVTAFKK